MSVREKMAHCVGCRDNFYNGNNDMGVRECWNLKSARLVKRVRVYLDQRPPWEQPSVKVFDCRHERGVVLMNPEDVERTNRACRVAMASRATQPGAQGGSE